MAGATNRAMKVAGIPKATQNVIRVNSGGAHTLKSAIAVAAAHGAPVPDKVHAHIAARDAKAGAKTAKSAATAENATKRAEARAVYERGNASSGDKLAAMRSNLRQLVSEKRQADKDVDRARGAAEQAAGARLGIPKKGPKAKQNQRAHREALDAAVNADPAVKRAAMAQVAARTALQSALQSRNATATARKAQRGAEAGGQQDLFSGAPAPRGPSPFERRMALRDARALRGAQALGAVMSAARKAKVANPSPAGPAQQRVADLRAERAKVTAASEAWKQSYARTQDHSSKETRELATAADAARRAYEQKSARHVSDMRQRHSATMKIALRFKRAADAAYSRGDREKSKALMKRRDQAMDRAERYDTTRMAHDRFMRLRGI